jgi:predicted ATPase/DNA-binding XRE family transcriptional regulator
MNTNGSFGNWLRQRRKALDLTQADLAHQVGCAITTIRKIEADRRRPSRQISERMADVLAISEQDRSAFLNFARRVTHPEPALHNDLSALTPTSNLPPQLTPFIGREAELAQITDRLNDPACRLLTLVGPGGIGKTRLALQAAADRVDAYADGVFFVSLTPVGTTTLISAAIASALQVSFYGPEDPDVQIVNYLRSKHVLLVLDNYEHLLGGIGLLADILANAPRVKLLVTSRERLNIQQEWALPVTGLPYPAQDANGSTGSYDAVDLFVQTARRIESGFVLAGNEFAVADICRAVEGMPLGIELAATWLRAMPCDQIGGEIRHDLDFLTTPLRNVAERHRSLRAVFEHSWALLSEAEREVVMKLSVFRGGCDLEAAEQVAGASLRLLAGLIDKSLVRLNPAGRYEMHELLRQFAADKLLEAGQADENRYRHLQYYLNLAERLEGQFFGPQHVTALDRLEVEHDNCRAALDWAAQSGVAEIGLRLAGALGFFWEYRAYWTEGLDWLEMFLAAAPNAAASVRAKALYSMMLINSHFHDAAYTRSLTIMISNLIDEVTDLNLKAWLIGSLGWAGHPVKGVSEVYLNEALAIFRQLGNQRGIYETLGSLGQRAFQLGDFATAGPLQEEAIRLARQSDDKQNLAGLIMLSGCKNWYEGKINQQTENLYHESLALFLELRDKLGIMMMLRSLGKFARLRGEDEQARVLFEKSLSLAQQSNDKGMIPQCLILLAELFSEYDEAERGAHILGAVTGEVELRWVGDSFSEKEVRHDYERALSAARAQLDEAAFAAAFAEGQAMTLDRAIALALSDAAVVEAI